jgi:hypothetical protein
MAARVKAVCDEALGARIVARRALHYASGSDPREDRPGHVRAGSALVRFGSGLTIVQDDADFVALIDTATGAVRSVPLPRRGSSARQFDDARGNKADKLDFEACVVVPLRGADTLVALGSGSTPARESILVLGLSGEEPRVVHAPDLYAALRGEPEFSGSELNVEGAVLVGDVIRLFQRGNGAPRHGLLPVNATCEFPLSYVLDLVDGRPARAPALGAVVQFDLGTVHGTPLTFTDAALVTSGEVVYVAPPSGACAVRDGAVVGAAVGFIRSDPRGGIEVRYRRSSTNVAFPRGRSKGLHRAIAQTKCRSSSTWTIRENLQSSASSRTGGFPGAHTPDTGLRSRRSQ